MNVFDCRSSKLNCQLGTIASMVAFGHTALGAGVGLLIYKLIGQSLPPAEELILAGAAGVVSHYVMDTVPHGHFFVKGDFRKQVKPVLLFDLGLGILLFAFWSLINLGLSQAFWSILFGIGGAQLPDVVDGLMGAEVLPAEGFLKTEHEFHQSTHWHGSGENGLLWGKRDIWQIVVAVISLAIIYLYSV